MADLKTTIAQTENLKNKTKTVATQIDNKLVELGGEQATDLADVSNKMDLLIKKNYKKIAFGTFRDEETSVRDTFTFNFNCAFQIKTLIAFVKIYPDTEWGNADYKSPQRIIFGEDSKLDDLGQYFVFGIENPSSANTSYTWFSTGKFVVENIDSLANLKFQNLTLGKAQYTVKWINWIAIG